MPHQRGQDECAAAGERPALLALFRNDFLARSLHFPQCAWLTRQSAMLLLQPHGQSSMLSRSSTRFRRSLLSEARSRPGSSV